MMGKSRVLITGGTGLLGKALLETTRAGQAVFATFHERRPPTDSAAEWVALDVRDAGAVARVFETVRPEVVIHTASVGSVDVAERDPGSVRRVNVDGTQAVGQACLAAQAQLVFISSNAVFDGSHPPYREGDPVGAVNRYGAIKIDAERWVREQCPAATIIRPILMYGWPFPGGRDNAVTRWLSRLESGQPIEVAEDIVSMPLMASNCAEAIWAAIERQRSGTYHVAGADRMSLPEFARIIAQVFGYDEQLIKPTPDWQFNTLAPRPLDTSFVTTKMEQELGVRPLGVMEGLTIMQRARVTAG